jgi:hypothetical protein
MKGLFTKTKKKKENKKQHRFSCSRDRING